MNQQLQGQGAAYDRVAPGTVVAALPRPAAPVVKSSSGPPLDGAPRGEDERVAVSHAQRQEGLGAAPRGEPTLDRASADLRLAGLEAENGQSVCPGVGDRNS